MDKCLMPNRNLKPKLTFPQKLWQIINDDTNKLLEWTDDGTSFRINYSLLDEYLTTNQNIFNITIRSSFTRLLVQHNFHKSSSIGRCRNSVNDDTIFEYSNVYFQRDRIGLLDKIVKNSRNSKCDPCKVKIISKQTSRLTWARQNLRLTLAMQHLARNKDFYVEYEKLRKTEEETESSPMFYENPLDTVKIFLDKGKILGYADENSSAGLMKFFEDFSGAENITLNSENCPLPATVTSKVVNQIVNEPNSHYRDNIIFTIDVPNDSCSVSIPDENDFKNSIIEMETEQSNDSPNKNHSNNIESNESDDLINPFDYFILPDSVPDQNTTNESEQTTASDLNRDIYFTEPSSNETKPICETSDELFDIKDISDLSEYQSFEMNEIEQFNHDIENPFDEPEHPPDYYSSTTTPQDDEAFANFFFQIRESLNLLNE